ncbi:MAG: hypothetical protein JWL60_681 [Gemmatimonadetes bacterium]|nr:hypothetical protein [Gemmatimonadota bacterium]
MYGEATAARTSLGETLDQRTGPRRNKFVSRPEVSGLGVLSDSLFVLIRYRDWRTAYVGRLPSGSLEYRAVSTIEVIDGRGLVREAFAVPDFATAIATEGNSRIVALIVQDRSRTHRVLTGTLPAN